MIRRVLRWVPALRALNPLNPKNGWARVRRRNFQLINNFVVMWSFVNQSVGATNRALAKREYVSLYVADEIRDTAVEVLRGVRARVTDSA